jgi:hypothetical protein
MALYASSSQPTFPELLSSEVPIFIVSDDESAGDNANDTALPLSSSWTMLSSTWSSQRQGCPGYVIELPADKTAFGSYPFHLHVEKSLPWSVAIFANGRTISVKSVECTEMVGINRAYCIPCGALKEGSYLKPMIRRMPLSDYAHLWSITDAFGNSGGCGISRISSCTELWFGIQLKSKNLSAICHNQRKRSEQGEVTFPSTTKPPNQRTDLDHYMTLVDSMPPSMRVHLSSKRQMKVSYTRGDGER